MAWTLAFSLTGGGLHAQERRTELRIGLVPALSPQHFVRVFSTMVGYLERRLDLEVTLKGAPNYAEFVLRARDEDAYDMILTGSDMYRYLERKAGYRAIARGGGEGNFALIAVRADSGITELSEVSGMRVALADPLSLSYRLGEMKLREAGIMLGVDTEMLITPTQNASMASMLNGLADVAIFMHPVLLRAPDDVVSRIRVIAETDRAIAHTMSVSPRMPEELARALQQSLIEMDGTPDGAPFFEAVRWPPFVKAEPGDYTSMDWTVEAIDAHLSSLASE